MQREGLPPTQGNGEIRNHCKRCREKAGIGCLFFRSCTTAMLGIYFFLACYDLCQRFARTTMESFTSKRDDFDKTPTIRGMSFTNSASSLNFVPRLFRTIVRRSFFVLILPSLASFRMRLANFFQSTSSVGTLPAFSMTSAPRDVQASSLRSAFRRISCDTFSLRVACVPFDACSGAWSCWTGRSPAVFCFLLESRSDAESLALAFDLCFLPCA